MALNISKFTNSSLGVGVTGKLYRVDENNLVGDNNKVFISIYDSLNDEYFNKEIIVQDIPREKNKELIINTIKELLLEILSR